MSIGYHNDVIDIFSCIGTGDPDAFFDHLSFKVSDQTKYQILPMPSAFFIVKCFTLLYSHLFSLVV